MKLFSYVSLYGRGYMYLMHVSIHNEKRVAKRCHPQGIMVSSFWEVIRYWQRFITGKVGVLSIMTVAYEPQLDKTNKMTVRPAKTQISLGIRPVWSESSLCAQLVAKDPLFLHADSEDSDQTGRMPSWSESSLGAHAILLVLSWGGTFQVTINSFKWRVKNEIMLCNTILKM